jgi:hypothetical protein
LKISPWAITITIWNNLRMCFLVWNIPRDVDKPSLIAHPKTNGGQWLKHVQTKSYPWQMCAQAEGHGLIERGWSWCRAAMVFSKGIVGITGWKVLVVWLYSSALPNIKHWWKQVIKESSKECGNGEHMKHEKTLPERKVSRLP